MPYPLPDGGPPYSTDLRWFLVAVPDEAAFVQAALGAYTEFTHYWKWGKEGREPGRNEAAQAWEDAVGATLEALEMGFPDTLLSYIDGVEALLQSLIDKPCCSGVADGLENIYDGSGLVGDTVNTDGEDVEVGSGTPPSPAEDWTEYASLLCDGASAWVDGLPNLFRWAGVLSEVVQTVTIAGATAIIAAILSGMAVPVAIAGVLLGTLNILEWMDDLRDQAAEATSFETWVTEAATYRQELICAIVTAPTAAAAWGYLQSVVEANFTAGAWAWINLLAFPGSIQRIFNLGSSIAGGYGTSCGTCEELGHVELVYGTDQGGGVYASELSAGCHYVSLEIWNDDGMTERWSTDWTGAQTSTSGSCGGAAIHRVVNESQTLVYSGDNVNYPVDELGHRYTVTHGSAFTVSISRTHMRHEGT